MLAASLCQVSAQTPLTAQPTAAHSVSTTFAARAAARTNASQSTVVASRQLAPGIESRIMLTADGRLYRDIVRDGVATPAPLRLNHQYAPSANASLYESFEAHVDELDWLPDGWTEINTEANIPTPEACAKNINNTWYGTNTGDDYWTAATTDGDKECFIHFTYNVSYTDSEGNEVNIPASPQDEWLISPAFTVKEGHNLYFLAEIDHGSLYQFDWDAWDFNRDIIDNDLEVLVSTDGGDNWTSLWKATTDVASKMSNDQLYDIMGTLSYASYQVSLADYYGQEVKLAWRYTNSSNGGFAGNSMAVDAITVDAPAAEASYQMPYGALLGGISTGLHVYTESYAVFPAWADVIWTAQTNPYTESVSWAFGDQTFDSEMAYVAGEPTYDSFEPFPVLTFANANGEGTYSFDQADSEKGGIIYGGRVPDILEGEATLMGNYDYQHKRMQVPSFDGVSYVYGTSAPDTWGSGIVQEAFGEFFYAPAAPFALENVYVLLGEFDADDDAEFTMEIFEVDAYGSLATEPAVKSTITASAVQKGGFSTACFPVVDAEGAPATYVVEGNVIVKISGFNSDKVRKFAACAQALMNDAEHNFAYMWFSFPSGSKALYAASDALSDYSSSVLISFDGQFNYLKAQDETVMLDETGKAEIAVQGYNDPSAWWIETEDQKLPLSAAAQLDWLTVTGTPGEADMHTLNLEAAPASANREVAVTIGTHGASTTFVVKQNASSAIESIAATASVKAAFEGDLLNVAGAQAGAAVKVYGIAGNLLAAATVAADGTATLDASQLGAGAYIVRVADKALKLVK